MTKSLRSVAAVSLAILCLFIAKLLGADGEKSRFVLEAYPLHIQAKLDYQRSRLRSAPAFVADVQNVREDLLLWAPGSIVTVCFVGGDAELRSRIAQIANTWSKYGNLGFDFGNLANPRSCSPGNPNLRYDVRIGFGYRGYWSLVGRESIKIAAQTETSMNFEGFDYNPPDDMEFVGTVLHEFGHAIGFHHEHQSPKDGCDKEFAWDKVTSYLEGPPNYWDIDTINRNMRQLPDSSLFSSTPHDKDSIMHYSFPADFFLKREESKCFSPQHYSLSKIDQQAMASAYPANAQMALAQRAERFSKIVSNPEVAVDTKTILLQEKLDDFISARAVGAAPPQ